jgi:hypothetical protein
MSADSGASGAPRPGWLAAFVVFLVALVVLVPTTADFGLTYDEPSYTFSQHVSVQWWARLAAARSWSDVSTLLQPDTLLYYWPYARHGVNFHPPLAGQLNLLSHELLKGLVSDTVARRMASVVEFALTVTLIFSFLGRRYGTVTGVIGGGALLLLPRVYGQAHLIDTDIPGLLLWIAAALAFWRGLNEPNGRRWRVAVGVVLGLAFVEKMATVAVALPLVLWLAATRPLRSIRAGDAPRALLDGLITLGLMALPLVLAYREITSLARLLPEPKYTDLFVHHPRTWMPGAILAAPLVVWLARRLLARVFPKSPLWGTERPALETLAALLAFPPLVVWLGNPEWWREAIPRLAHYYALNTNRRGALPDIQILYFGQMYEFALPWHSAWVLLAITVPVALLFFGLIGALGAVLGVRRNALPPYFLLHMSILPVLRIFPTPAHDGVRLFLPTFVFLCILAALGVRTTALTLGRRWPRRAVLIHAGLAVAVLGSELVALVKIHPYELSYYNLLVGGPRGAWKRGFELTYWYDAFTPQVIAALNDRLPPGSHVTFSNDLSAPATFQELQALGQLRADIRLDTPSSDFPYLWLLTHDSKATANSRLLFALRPWFSVEPRQLDGARVLTVADPQAAARALALQLLTDAGDTSPEEPPRAPEWVRTWIPPLARLWGDGLIRTRKLAINSPIFEWARRDRDGLVAAAGAIVDRRADLTATPRPDPDAIFADAPDARILYRALTRYDAQRDYSRDLLRRRPDALLDAAHILTQRPDDVERVLTRYGYTDTELLGGYLDRDLTGPSR